jgi:hypothetical protein
MPKPASSCSIQKTDRTFEVGYGGPRLNNLEFILVRVAIAAIGVGVVAVMNLTIISEGTNGLWILVIVASSVPFLIYGGWVRSPIWSVVTGLLMLGVVAWVSFVAVSGTAHSAALESIRSVLINFSIVGVYLAVHQIFTRRRRKAARSSG